MPEQARVRQSALSSQVVGGFVHVRGVPVHDRGDDKIQGHDALLLSVVPPITDAALGMGEHRARQCVACVACLALVETRLALHAQLQIFDPVQHEQRALDAPDFPEREVEPVLLALGAELARIGYTPKALAERFDAQPAEIRRFLSGRLDPERTAELGVALRNAGIPT